MRYITLAASVAAFVLLFSCAHARQSPAPAPKAPACYSQAESCLDQWYEYGDQTGDYGPVDAAE